MPNVCMHIRIDILNVYIRWHRKYLYFVYTTNINILTIHQITKPFSFKIEKK